MQTIASESIGSIGAISEVTSEVNSLSQTIVAAVEEQTVMISEIAKNIDSTQKSSKEITADIGNVAKSLNEVATTIHDVSAKAGGALSQASDTDTGIKALIQFAGDLSSLVEKFRIN